MYSKIVPFFLYCVSAVHAGSGSEIGIVDLPIQREKHTGFPKVESSSLKGAIRAAVTDTLEVSGQLQQQEKNIERVFGGTPKKDGSDGLAGAIALADARVLLFPVKSAKGVFAWITCPFVLNRFNQEMDLYNLADKKLPLAKVNTVSSKQLFVIKGKLVLEEYTYEMEEDQQTKELAQQLAQLLFAGQETNLDDRLVVLEDDDFTDFVKLSTEVNARIRIDSATGIVQEGALWYEENVPPETVFYSCLFAGNCRTTEKGELHSDQQVLAFMQNEQVFPPVFQLGGNSTLGRGIMRKIWL
jgi:CRISPR-associated protein Cmr4